jgi:hypothetical protein
MRAFRRHATWYTKGFPRSAALRDDLTKIETLADLEAALAGVDRDEPFPPSAMRVARGKTGALAAVALPDGYLDDLDDLTPPPAEDADCGG